MEIIITWEVEDGYAGKSRPQKTVVRPLDTYTEEEWNEMTEAQKRLYIEECVQEDFEQTISFSIDDYEI